MKKAFTLMELVIVVITISVIAVFAIPNFKKAVDRRYESSIVLDLTAINAAQEIYKSRYGAYYTFSNPSGQGKSSINAKLNLNIGLQGAYFLCHPRSGVYECFGSIRGFSIYMNPGSINPGTNPYCSPPGSCPTL